MNATFNDEQTTLSHALDQVISQHGRLRVAAVLLLRLLWRPASRDMPAPITDYLRRDIGLAPEHAPMDRRAGFGTLIR